MFKLEIPSFSDIFLGRLNTPQMTCYKFGVKGAISLLIFNIFQSFTRGVTDVCVVLQVVDVSGGRHSDLSQCHAGSHTARSGLLLTRRKAGNLTESRPELIIVYWL